MCVICEGNISCFCLQVNEINGMLSFKMGIKFAASVYMGKDLLDVLNIITNRSPGI